MKTALITGVTGQDGSYLAELLLEKGYEVVGVKRRTSSICTDRIDHIMDHRNFSLVYGSMQDTGRLHYLINEYQPEEVYNLAAQSHVKVSFDQPVFTADINSLGTLRLLEAIHKIDKTIKFYQASSSEMYGKVQAIPQNETTPFHPQSPYACSKVFAYWQTMNYREAYDLFASNGILFNHESPRRGETFVTRKITRAATRIKLGLQEKLYLGNLDAKRDWGFAGDYIEAMWLILQHERSEDFVIATGETRAVSEFLDETFRILDLDWKEYVGIDPRYYRPVEVDLLQGDAAKARKLLGWEPKVDFKTLVKMMVESDMKLAEKEKLIADNSI